MSAVQGKDVQRGHCLQEMGPCLMLLCVYGMQQHNYPLLYNAHLNSADSINMHAFSPRTTTMGQRLCVGLRLNSNRTPKSLVSLDLIFEFCF